MDEIGNTQSFIIFSHTIVSMEVKLLVRNVSGFIRDDIIFSGALLRASGGRRNQEQLFCWDCTFL